MGDSGQSERHIEPAGTARWLEEQSDRKPFHVVTIGWNETLISNLLDRIEERSDVRFSHVITSTRDLLAFDHRRGRRGLYALRDHYSFKRPSVDRELLGSLERPNIPTIHNMIMGDRVIRYLAYEDSLSFATSLARALQKAFEDLKPSVVIASFDNLDAGMSLAVARKLGIPWFALSFTALPVGLTGFCTGLSPNTVFAVQEHEEEKLRRQAESTLEKFVARATIVPAYISANSLSMAVSRLPSHARAFAARLIRSVARDFDKYTEYSLAWLCRQYFRKRLNVVRMPKHWFCEVPPSRPYVFFGLHMQPESSIDVWAPFHSDQFVVVEAIARATPPTHEVLVKPHISDTDSYSRGDLTRLRRLPGVRLVSPFANSRDFIEGASLVLTIMGTMGMEAALLGKPVLMFGESKVSLMPSVSTVGPVSKLPGQIRSKLAEEHPSRESIMRGLMSYLALYAPGCYNDWNVRPSDEEIGHFVTQFQALELFLQAQSSIEAGANATT